MHFANVSSLGPQAHPYAESDRLSLGHLRFEPHDIHFEVLAEDDPRYEKKIDLVPGQNDPHDCKNGQCKRIYICVSGHMYETQLGTLNRYPNTLLGNPIKRRLYWDPEKRCYYLNQHAPTFGAILYYYQSGGRLYCPDDIPEDVFLRELEFYQLGSDVLREYKIRNGFLPEPNIALPKHKWRQKLWLILEYPSSSNPAKVIGVLSLLIILLSIINFCLETLPMFDKASCKVDNSTWIEIDGEWQPIGVLDHNSPFFIIECLCAFWFTSEVILRFLSTPSLKGFIMSWMNLFDVGAVMPFYIILFVVYTSGSCDDTKRSSTSIVFLRVLRLFRAFRIFKLTKHSKGMQILGMTIKKSLEELSLFGLFLGIAVIFFSASYYYADMYDTDSENITSIPDGFWLTIITMCTVGYGDVTPQGIAGKLVGSVCVVSGVVTIALLVPVVVSNFSNYYSHELSGMAGRSSSRQRSYNLVCPTKH